MLVCFFLPAQRWTALFHPQKFLEKIRIDNAKFLLVQNEMSIAEVAYACGFSSQSYFTKAFKEVTMQTPGEFLKTSFVKYDENK